MQCLPYCKGFFKFLPTIGNAIKIKILTFFIFFVMLPFVYWLHFKITKHNFFYEIDKKYFFYVYEYYYSFLHDRFKLWYILSNTALHVINNTYLNCWKEELDSLKIQSMLIWHKKCREKLYLMKVELSTFFLLYSLKFKKNYKC